jgi:hypothetical protein
MDSRTHTQMQTLVQRASGTGTDKLNSFYSDGGANNPPPSPTAKWKAEMHSYEQVQRDMSRFPYLPHPYPLKRRGRERDHPGGFVSLQEPFEPPKFPDQEQVYMTHGEWWQAQRPPQCIKAPKDATFSTSFWPYGRRITCVASMDKDDQWYNLDKRILKNYTFYKAKRDPPPTSSLSRSRSSMELIGSQAEHFGYNRQLGRTTSSHASATFHAENRMAPGEPFAATIKNGRNVWESMQAQASTSPPGTLQRATSAPSSLSVEANVGRGRQSSFNKPQKHLWDKGLGQRTQAEWCLPQPPSYDS